MGKTTRLCVLVVSLLSVLGGLASSAAAVHWHNSGSTTFTGSGAAGTLSVTGITVSCSTAHATGTVPVTTTGTVFRSNGTVSFTGCTVAGSPWTLDCSYVMTGTAQDGVGMGSIITGTTDITCDSYSSNVKLCHAGGTINGSYSNTVPAAATLNTGGSVIYRGANCPVGDGDLAHLSPKTSNSTSANPPTITRTA